MPPLLIIVGLGEGDVLTAIDQRSPHTRVIALEPDPLAARAFVGERHRGWRESGRLLYLTGPAYDGADQAWRQFPQSPDAFTLLVHPALQASSPGVVNALRTVKRILFAVRGNAEARRRFAPLYLANVLRNAPAIAAGRDVRALANAFAGVPAVIAAAGPSLDGALDDLRDIDNRALLIAVDTALRPLLHAGITPPFVVGADPSPLNARHFEALPECPATALIAESALDPRAAAVFHDRTFWFRLAAHPPWPWLNQIGVDVGRLDMWGSVLTAAFQFACLAGCDPIVIVGADLAYTGGRPYCRGTTYEFDWAAATAGGRELAEVWSLSTSRSGVVIAPDLRGGETLTTGSMLSFRDWMVAASKRSGRHVVNASGAGTLFGDGIQPGSLRLSLPAARRIPRLDELHDRVTLPSAPVDPTPAFRQVRTALDRSDPVASPIAEWMAFTGDGFNRAAIEGALEAALGSVEENAGPGLARMPVPWTYLHEHSSARGLLFQLPEALARFRVQRNDETPASSVDRTDGHCAPQLPGDRATALVLALNLLGGVARMVSSARDVPTAPATPGRTPVSALYDWPDTTRWAVQTFEALIENVEQQRARTHERAFWTSPVVPAIRIGSTVAAPLESRRSATHALVILALDWVRSFAGALDDDSSEVATAVDRLAGIEALFRRPAPIGSSSGQSVLVVKATTATGAAALEIPLGLDAAMLARPLTGFAGDFSSGYPLLRLDAGAMQISVDVRAGDESQRSSGFPERDAVRLDPRALSDERLPRMTICYADARGAICVASGARESVVIDEQGETYANHQWPRPIVAERPFGTDGAVAWGYGDSRWPDAAAAYVMYRHRRDDAVQIDELPVIPSVCGCWWNGRLYWSCVPSRVGTWAGVASWVPGEPIRYDIPDLTLYAIYADHDGLELHPRMIDPSRLSERRLLSAGWRWLPGGSLETFDLGPRGAESSRATRDGWTAVARPEADRVLIATPGGDTTSLICHHPVRLAWVGRSLLVCTGQAELLLFSNLQRRVEPLQQSHTRSAHATLTPG